jgi:hypothetical protein
MATPTGTQIVDFARQQLGEPYVWAAEGPDEFDCSGLVNYVYRHFGIKTPRTTSDMMAKGSNLVPITAGQLQPGDLVLSSWGSNKPHSHVAIYAGNGKLIEASHPGTNVRYVTYGPSYKSHTDAIRRVPGVNGAVGGGATGGGVFGTAGGILGGVFAAEDWIPKPGNVTDALTNLGNAMGGIATSVVGVGELATTVTRALLPSNMLRAGLFVFGTVFILLGVLFLAREVKESSP